MKSITESRKLAGLYLFAFCLLCTSLLAAAWWYPKMNRNGLANPLGSIRHYRGFWLTDSRGLLGVNVFRIDVILTLPEDGSCMIEYRHGSEAHPFIAYYPDGQLRARGYCKVTYDHLGLPKDMGDIVDGTFVSPDGNIASELRGGTGIETFFTADGVKIWEAKQREGRRSRVTVWHRNGQIRVAETYTDGKRHGTFRYYSENGALRGTIMYKDGFEIERALTNTD